jgi:endonuclease YncB( thermonuclease family)
LAGKIPAPCSFAGFPTEAERPAGCSPPCSAFWRAPRTPRRWPAAADGDTITVLDSRRQQHKIRLAGIDAPEKAQPYGQRSKENLSRLVFGKDVRVDWNKRDRYGRTVGKVWVQPPDCPRCGPTLDAGQAQLAAGMAWWYRKYAGDQSAEDRGRYEFEENEARVRRVGLWQDPDPVPPWDWRRRQSSPAN